MYKNDILFVITVHHEKKALVKLVESVRKWHADSPIVIFSDGGIKSLPVELIDCSNIIFKYKCDSISATFHITTENFLEDRYKKANINAA